MPIGDIPEHQREEYARIIREAEGRDPFLEPFFSMSKEYLAELVAKAADAEEVEFLNGFVMDKMTERELATYSHAMVIGRLLIEEYSVYGNGQCTFLASIAAEIAARIDRDMPARGTPMECN